MTSRGHARVVARGLAEAFVAGRWQTDDLVERGGRVLDRRGRWLRPLAHRVLAAFRAGPRPRVACVASFLLADQGFLRSCEKSRLILHGSHCLAPVMCPAPGAPSSWVIPEITTPAALAERLGLGPSKLDWLADCQARGTKELRGPLQHYRDCWKAKRSGSARLVESPKSRLKRAPAPAPLRAPQPDPAA